MKGFVKTVYDNFKGKPTITSTGIPYKTVVIVDAQGGENKYRIFPGDIFNIISNLKEHDVDFEVTVNGQYTNLSSIKSLGESKPTEVKPNIFKDRDEAIGEMAREKLMCEYRKLAFDVLKEAGRIAVIKNEFKTSDDYITSNLFDIEALALKLKNPTIRNAPNYTTQEPEEIIMIPKNIGVG